MTGIGARVAAPVALLSLAILFLTGCGGSAPAAATLLKNAHDKFNATSSFHFVMTVQHPGTVAAGGFNIIGASGDVAPPDRLKATANVDAGFISVQIQLIIIGSQEWYTDPLTGQFVATNQFSSYMRIFDPETGLGSLLTTLKNSQPAKRRQCQRHRLLEGFRHSQQGSAFPHLWLRGRRGCQEYHVLHQQDQ